MTRSLHALGLERVGKLADHLQHVGVGEGRMAVIHIIAPTVDSRKLGRGGRMVYAGAIDIYLEALQNTQQKRTWGF